MGTKPGDENTEFVKEQCIIIIIFFKYIYRHTWEDRIIVNTSQNIQFHKYRWFFSKILIHRKYLYSHSLNFILIPEQSMLSWFYLINRIQLKWRIFLKTILDGNRQINAVHRLIRLRHSYVLQWMHSLSCFITEKVQMHPFCSLDIFLDLKCCVNFQADLKD